MKQDNKKKPTPQQKLLNEIKKDLTAHKHTQPRRYRENLDYFQRMAVLS